MGPLLDSLGPLLNTSGPLPDSWAAPLGAKAHASGIRSCPAAWWGMHRTQLRKKSAVKIACFCARAPFRSASRSWNAGWPDRERQRCVAIRSVPPPRIGVTNHPKSSLHRRQCHRQNRRDSNARKITASTSENS